MFKGEAASLHAMSQTKTIRVPKPVKVKTFDDAVIGP